MILKSRTYITILSLLFLAGCGNQRSTVNSDTITVSIYPIKELVENIAGNDFKINVLVPQSTSPETYEPSHRQMIESSESFVYIHTGLLDFEHNLNLSIKYNSPTTTLLGLDRGIDLIYGTHSHEHSHNEGHRECEHHGTDGADPHIWLSVSTLKVMTGTIYEFLHSQFPDSTRYTDNYKELLSRLDSADTMLKQMFIDGNKVFVINHPSLTYLAHDYGLTQLSMEEDGKEPSVEHYIQLIERSKEAGVRILINQKQNTSSVVSNLAKELGARIEVFDPLAENNIDNILYISKIISSNGVDPVK